MVAEREAKRVAAGIPTPQEELKMFAERYGLDPNIFDLLGRRGITLQMLLNPTPTVKQLLSALSYGQRADIEMALINERRFREKQRNCAERKRPAPMFAPIWPPHPGVNLSTFWRGHSLPRPDVETALENKRIRLEHLLFRPPTGNYLEAVGSLLNAMNPAFNSQLQQAVEEERKKYGTGEIPDINCLGV